MKTNSRYFPNAGILHCSLNQTELYVLNEEVKLIQNNFSSYTDKAYNSNLAGCLQHEYKLSEDTLNDLNKVLEPCIFAYKEQFGYVQHELNAEIKNPVLRLGTAWVNFQKKYEFNPLHNHDGVLSFALWLKVPYKLKDEMELPFCRNSNTNIPGHFQFVYSDIMGLSNVETIPVDETFENTLVMFPSKMLHTVYPFYTSDDYRISVSGNFYFREENVETLG